MGIGEEYIQLLNQIVNTYSMGYYFPAMTSSGALIERMLNRLVLRLKKYHTTDPDYKKIYNKESIQDWDILIELLKRWGIINDEREKQLYEIKKLRNESVHYNKDYDFKNQAPIMISKTSDFIETMWSVTKRNDIFFVIPGEFWVRKSIQNTPFVIEFVLPMCYYASPSHRIEGQKLFEENPIFGELTDDEFSTIRIEYSRKLKS